MKKAIITLAIVLGISMTTFADGGGLFQRGAEPQENGNRGEYPGMPGHGGTGNADAGEAPLGTGIAIMTAFGAAYLVGKRRKED